MVFVERSSAHCQIGPSAALDSDTALLASAELERRVPNLQCVGLPILIHPHMDFIKIHEK
jgi:hypothetical protein